MDVMQMMLDLNQGASRGIFRETSAFIDYRIVHKDFALTIHEKGRFRIYVSAVDKSSDRLGIGDMAWLTANYLRSEFDKRKIMVKDNRCRRNGEPR